MVNLILGLVCQVAVVWGVAYSDTERFDTCDALHWGLCSTTILMLSITISTMCVAKHLHNPPLIDKLETL